MYGIRLAVFYQFNTADEPSPAQPHTHTHSQANGEKELGEMKIHSIYLNSEFMIIRTHTKRVATACVCVGGWPINWKHMYEQQNENIHANSKLKTIQLKVMMMMVCRAVHMLYDVRARVCLILAIICAESC